MDSSTMLRTRHRKRGMKVARESAQGAWLVARLGCDSEKDCERDPLKPSQDRPFERVLLFLNFSSTTRNLSFGTFLFFKKRRRTISFPCVRIDPSRRRFVFDRKCRMGEFDRKIRTEHRRNAKRRSKCDRFSSSSIAPVRYQRRNVRISSGVELLGVRPFHAF